MYRKRYAPLAVAPDPVCVSAESHAWFWLQQSEPEGIRPKYTRDAVKHWKASCTVGFMTRQSTEMKNRLNIMYNKHCTYCFLLWDLDKNREQLVSVKEMADGCRAQDNRCLNTAHQCHMQCAQWQMCYSKHCVLVPHHFSSQRRAPHPAAAPVWSPSECWWSPHPPAAPGCWSATFWHHRVF